MQAAGRGGIDPRTHVHHHYMPKQRRWVNIPTWGVASQVGQDAVAPEPLDDKMKAKLDAIEQSSQASWAVKNGQSKQESSCVMAVI